MLGLEKGKPRWGVWEVAWGGWAIFPVQDAGVQHPRLLGRARLVAPGTLDILAGGPGCFVSRWGTGGPCGGVWQVRFAACWPQGWTRPPPSCAASARSVRLPWAGGGCRSPAAPATSRRKWVCRSAAPCRHARSPMETRAPWASPKDRSPRDPIPICPPAASSCPSVCPGIGYPLFPAGSLNRALATKTPPPLYLGAEGRRGEAHGSLASGRNGGSAAVSATRWGGHGASGTP